MCLLNSVVGDRLTFPIMYTLDVIEDGEAKE